MVPRVLRIGMLLLPLLLLLGGLGAARGQAPPQGSNPATGAAQQCIEKRFEPYAAVRDNLGAVPTDMAIEIFPEDVPFGQVAVTDVSVIGLQVLHACVPDLQIRLCKDACGAPTSNTSVTLLENGCSSNITNLVECSNPDIYSQFFNVWTSFVSSPQANTVDTTNDKQTCNVRDSSASVLRPGLRKFRGKTPVGTWFVSIRDQFKPTAGLAVGWALRVCFQANATAALTIPAAGGVAVACPGSNASVSVTVSTDSLDALVSAVSINWTSSASLAHPDNSGAIQVASSAATTLAVPGTDKSASTTLTIALSGQTPGVPAFRHLEITVTWEDGSGGSLYTVTVPFWGLFADSATTLADALSVSAPADFFGPQVAWQLNGTFAPADGPQFNRATAKVPMSLLVEDGAGSPLITQFEIASENSSAWLLPPLFLNSQALDAGTSTKVLKLSPGSVCSAGVVATAFQAQSAPAASCQTYVSTEGGLISAGTDTFLPSPLEFGTASSATVSRIGAVRVAVAHTRPTDLDLTLIGPEGGQFVILRSQQMSECSAEWNMDMVFQDTAGSAPACSVVNGSVSFLPDEPLSGALSSVLPTPSRSMTAPVLSPLAGQFTLVVRDPVQGNGGQLLGWELELCNDGFPANALPGPFGGPFPSGNMTSEYPVVPLDPNAFAPPDGAASAQELEEFSSEPTVEADPLFFVVLGVLFGLAAILCILAICIFILAMRQRRYQQLGEIELEDMDAETRASVRMFSTVKRNSKGTGAELTDVTIGDRLGGGNFGDVYLGTWQGDTEVALKRLKSAEDVADFITEAKFLKKLHHPNIVQYFGIYENPDNKVHYIVTEYMSGGSCDMLIRGTGPDEFPLVTLLDMTRGCASGMQYLTQQKLVHRDLSLRNVLVTEQEGRYLCKVADFGLARTADKGIYQTDDKTMPVKWCPPEALQHGTFSHASDVWAFGVLMWEMLSYGKLPWAGVSNEEVVKRVVAGKVLQQPRTVNNESYVIMASCWASDPDDRPTFNDLFTKISKLLKSTASDMEDSELPTWLQNYSGGSIAPSVAATPVRQSLYMMEGEDEPGNRTSIYMTEDDNIELKLEAAPAESIYNNEDLDASTASGAVLPPPVSGVATPAEIDGGIYNTEDTVPDGGIYNTEEMVAAAIPPPIDEPIYN